MALPPSRLMVSATAPLPSSLRAVGGQQLRGGLADAARGAADDGNLAAEIKDVGFHEGLPEKNGQDKQDSQDEQDRKFPASRQGNPRQDQQERKPLLVNEAFFIL
jgi:hypothetical protein